MGNDAQESSRTSRLDFIMNEDEFDPDATEPSGTSPAPFNRDGQSPQASNMNDVDAPDTVMPDTTLPTPPPLTPSPGLARVRGTSRARHKIPEMSGFVSFFFLEFGAGAQRIPSTDHPNAPFPTSGSMTQVEAPPFPKHPGLEFGQRQLNWKAVKWRKKYRT